MDVTIAGPILACSLVAGSMAGAMGRLKDNYTYEQFMNDPGNYQLVDRHGHPVSQELKK